MRVHPTEAATPPFTLTADEVLRDLRAGRGTPPRPADRVLSLDGRRRPTRGGLRSRATAVRAFVLGALAPRLARRALARLWFTPWTHAGAHRPVDDAGMDARSWTLTTAGTTLRGWQAGTGPTAVLVHGWGSRSADLRHLGADLVAAGWRVVLPDLPGHGRSDGHVTDIHELRDAVAAVVEEERPRLVVAHSLGALSTLLALEQVVHTPDGVVLVAPARSAEHALATFAGRSGLRPGLVRQLRLAIEDRLGPDAWQDVDGERAAGSMTASVLVVQDADDREVRFADAQAITAAWAGPARMVTTTGLGHRRVLRAAAPRFEVAEFAAAVRVGRAAVATPVPSPA